MFGIIMLHRVLCRASVPLLNADYVETAISRVDKVAMMNSTGLVATFFVISGFLEAWLLMKHNAKHRRFSVAVLVQQFANRYLRLLPALAVALAIETQWLQYMGSGPFWGQTADKVMRDCQQYWWTHFLFINNYVAQGSTVSL
ncbi:nose resistant to fluoxetine protein 6-like [Thrips palmi]|uniref:Nose resistant to fluoxetine protein 6-like n=1 Tax=Thrips palmi TaxID=161013 RepID=A0A6P8YMH2_THRPL|nr:nose resistant to fluoxetine protein 6-like [Thrips palmi]